MHNGPCWSTSLRRVDPRARPRPHDMRRTISAILWRHEKGAKWRAIPNELGPWWWAAQVFIAGHGLACGSVS
jgi:transposase